MQRAGAHFKNFYKKMYCKYLTLNKVIRIVQGSHLYHHPCPLTYYSLGSRLKKSLYIYGFLVVYNIQSGARQGWKQNGFHVAYVGIHAAEEFEEGGGGRKKKLTISISSSQNSTKWILLPLPAREE
jgi:hypothetical protein